MFLYDTGLFCVISLAALSDEALGVLFSAPVHLRVEVPAHDVVIIREVARINL